LQLLNFRDILATNIMKKLSMII